MITLMLVCLLGLAIGSFAGVVVWRLHNGWSIATGRSKCLHCHHLLAAKDLIPIVSWLALKGRCRYCGRPIGAQDFLVETGTGLLFGLSYLALAPVSSIAWLHFGLWLLILTALIVLSVYDLRWLLLPDRVMYPALALAALLVVVEAIMRQSGVVLLEHALAALAGGASFYALAAISQGRWLGGGDIKLAALMGMVLGGSKLLVALIVAFNSAAVISLILIGLHQRGRHDAIPFGPFLVLGTIAAMLYGPALIHWYFRLGGLAA